MKCLSCDVILHDFEDQRRFRESGARVELCNKCVKYLPPDLELVGGETSQEPAFDADVLELDVEWEWDVKEDETDND